MNEDNAEKRREEAWENLKTLRWLGLNGNARWALHLASEPWMETGEGANYTSFSWLKQATTEDLDAIRFIGPTYAKEILALVERIRNLVRAFGD